MAAGGSLTIPPTPGWPGVPVEGCGVLVFVGVLVRLLRVAGWFVSS